MDQRIFQLTGEQFENLCFDLLVREYDFDTAMFSRGTGNGIVDIIAKTGPKETGIVVKHKYSISKQQFQNDLAKLAEISNLFHNLIYITSAKIEGFAKFKGASKAIRVLDQNLVAKMLQTNPAIQARYFSEVVTSKKKQRFSLGFSLLGLIASIVSGILTTYLTYTKPVDNSDKIKAQITNVQSALAGIKTLEKQLSDIMKDMREMDVKNQKIKAEHEQLKDVESIIENKKALFNEIFSHEPMWKKVLNTLIGVIIGIFTSIIGNILYKRWKLDRELRH